MPRGVIECESILYFLVIFAFYYADSAPLYFLWAFSAQFLFSDFGIPGLPVGDSNKCQFMFTQPAGFFNSPRYPASVCLRKSLFPDSYRLYTFFYLLNSFANYDPQKLKVSMQQWALHHIIIAAVLQMLPGCMNLEESFDDKDLLFFARVLASHPMIRLYLIVLLTKIAAKLR